MTETPSDAVLLAIGRYATGRGTHQDMADPFSTATDQRPLSARDSRSRKGPFETFDFRILDLFRISIFGFRVWALQNARWHSKLGG